MWIRVLQQFAMMLALVCAGIVQSAGGATLSGNLESQLSSAAGSDSVGTVIVTFEGERALSESDVEILRSAGIDGGYTLENLGMAAVEATAGQVRELDGHPAVRSIWSNDELEYYMHQASVLGGVDRLRIDSHLTIANGGLPVSGRGDFSVVINDSGIDGTHLDVEFPDHVVENAQIVTDTETLEGFTPLLAAEGIPNTDTHIGHGTHVAGIVAGTGARSGGLYTGVAPGANLIGTGSGAGLFILNALGGFEWSLANQFLHGIRVINNSWGSSGDFDPDNPINVASKRAADRNIVVVFSAGNSGPGIDTHNPYGKAPWVISVAAGTKEGMLAGFSSRGKPAYERLNDADPNNDFDAPTITAPGTGRFYDANTGTFTSDIISVRSSSNLVANGGDADSEIPPAYLPYYTQISGTSMSAPFVAGVAALMLEADPTLSTEEIKRILVETATPMPGFSDFEVGAGFVNARAAVDEAFNRSRSYGAVADPDFNFGIDINQAEPHDHFDIEFTYLDEEANLHHFPVEEGLGILHVRIDFGNTVVTDEGNTFFLTLHAPDGEEITVGPALPLLTPSHLEAVVRDPVPGEWAAEVSAGFLLGLAPATVPERVDGTIKRYDVVPDPVTDIAGHPHEAVIDSMLRARRMDVLDDGQFHPDESVTRAGFARVLALNAPLRQFLAPEPRFGDVDESFRVFAESVDADGSSLRGFDFHDAGVMATSGTAFSPDTAVDRLDAAVAFVRALGRDDEARELAGTTVTVDGTELVDNDEIPSELRGYVQISLDAGIQQAFPAEVVEVAPGEFQAVPGPRFEPDTEVTRAKLAVTLDRFAPVFAAGPRD